MSESAQSVAPITRIQPSRGWVGVNLGELWRHRELLYFLIWRDVKVRYKQTLLGAAWAILKPLFSMVIFTIIFGRLAEVPTDGAPAPVFYFTALLPWILFQDGVSKASASLVAGRSLVTKVYFPRMVVPLASVLAGLVDFALSGLVLVAMMVFYGVRAGPALWSLPLFLILTLLASIGVGLWLSALNVAYRDIAYVTPFVLQAWMYASPVAYSATLIPEGAGRLAYGLNPMAGVIQGFRWAVLGVGQPEADMLWISLGVAGLLLVSGVAYFRRVERTFADVI
ncbi:MAG TPA: ABC transporter permease [Anaerolineales bacterium]|jgi:lipopolysaccharide transport system permease protein|nr:ABC transporter permease [Anaerolineales bacterium]